MAERWIKIVPYAQPEWLKLAKLWAKLERRYIQAMAKKRYKAANRLMRKGEKVEKRLDMMNERRLMFGGVA